MPNWCEGVFKVRGTKQNVINYLQELLKVPPVEQNKNPEPEIIFSNGCDELKFELKNCNHFYLKHTRRAFINTAKISILLNGDEDDYPEQMIIASIPHFVQAWGIIPENYTELSKKHNVDLRIFGFEHGMEFTQEVEIHKGSIVKSVEREFDNYKWDVPFSHLGG